MDLADPATFSRAYDQHARSVHAVAFRVLGDSARAQDVVQDVFLRLWRAPRKFDAGRGELGAYLRLMARSRALDVWREGQAAGRAQDRLEVAVALEPARAHELPDGRAVRADADRAVRKALRELPDKQREALVLAFWGGLSADEVARRVGVPLGTAKSRIRLGLARLRTAAPELAAAA